MTLQETLQKRLDTRLRAIDQQRNEVTIEVSASDWLVVARMLSETPDLGFEQLVDLCGVDYLEYGKSEWAGQESVYHTGYSRGVNPATVGRLKFGDEVVSTVDGRPRFAVVAHLLSYSHNWRLRVRIYCDDDEAPSVPSVVSVWSGANWFEREAFDLYGILFDDHPDLRRILTDYGFVGHPFRKDFPLIGNVEVRFDPDKKRVVYEPVSIEPRVLVPKVRRQDSRYLDTNGN